jgi:hypothetical protein
MHPVCEIRNLQPSPNVIWMIKSRRSAGGTWTSVRDLGQPWWGAHGWQENRVATLYMVYTKHISTFVYVFMYLFIC